MRSLLLSLSFFTLLTGCNQNIPQSAADFPAIDTHVHLYDTTRPEGVPWPRPEHKILYKPILPANFQPISDQNKVHAVVVVQAGSWTQDNQWNLDITNQQPHLYQGIVGNLSLEIGKPSFTPIFNQLIKDKRYVGFRISSRPDPDNFKNPLFWEHLRQVASNNKTIDILIGRSKSSYKLDDAIIIAEKNPNLKIIIDHVLAIPINAQPISETNIAKAKKLASFPNVHCKVSGLFGKSTIIPAPKNHKHYAHNLNLVYETFGEDRLIFGSDWPVTMNHGSYIEHKDIIFQHFKSKGRSTLEKLFYKNATRFYNIPGIE